MCGACTITLHRRAFLESTWLFLKRLSIDGIFLFGLLCLWIPWLQWTFSTTVAVFIAHAVANAFLIFWIPIHDISLYNVWDSPLDLTQVMRKLRAILIVNLLLIVFLAKGPKFCPYPGKRPHAVYNPSPVRWSWSQVQNWIDDCLDSFIEKKVPKELTRFKWTCCCGRTFTETVRELKPGTAEAWMQSVSDIQTGRVASSLPAEQRAEAGRLESIVLGDRSALFTQEVSQSGSRGMGSAPGHSIETAEANDHLQRRFALLCFKEGRHTIRLVHSEVTHKYSDQEMFE